ncbi:MAG: nucleotidyl transferase AbiEii/AbiGii toxin family protein [Nitrospirae bacterium]|nr:nucleotidyl transferase AbiEii/AbiGii toxin family protein [Nitrospirota bacterium]
METTLIFKPNISTLPQPQVCVWRELDATPDHFTLYGGTALALRLGHRASVDFDFFSNQPFVPHELVNEITYLKDAELVQVATNTLKCRMQRGGPVLVSFFGGLGLGIVARRGQAHGSNVYAASLLDIAGTIVAVVQQRAEAKDYLYIDALLRHGVQLQAALAAGLIIYGRSFNPIITLKALSYFDDVPTLPVDVQERLSAALKNVNPTILPALTPYMKRPDDKETTP